MRNMGPAIAAFGYSAASVVVGPLIFVAAFSFTRGGGDYCDLVYRQDDGWDPRREAEFRNAEIFQVSAAAVMVVVGVALLGLLAWSVLRRTDQGRRRLQTPAALWDVGAALSVIVMMLGYLLLIDMAGPGGQTC